MRIVYMNPVSDDRGRNVCVATIDIELNEDVRLYGLRLLRMEDGEFRVYAPQAGKRRTATFSHEMVRRITELAVERWERWEALNAA